MLGINLSIKDEEIALLRQFGSNRIRKRDVSSANPVVPKEEIRMP